MFRYISVFSVAMCAMRCVTRQFQCDVPNHICSLSVSPLSQGPVCFVRQTEVIPHKMCHSTWYFASPPLLFGRTCTIFVNHPVFLFTCWTSLCDMMHLLNVSVRWRCLYRLSNASQRKVLGMFGIRWQINYLIPITAANWRTWELLDEPRKRG